MFCFVKGSPRIYVLEDSKTGAGFNYPQSGNGYMLIPRINYVNYLNHFHPFQNEAEDMLLQHSGEYIYKLITKKLDMPQRQRHITKSMCLCQYVEQKVYNLVV